MDQPTPKVTRTDVEHVVRRDFLPDQYDTVMSILAEYGGGPHRGQHRVQLAALKLADGSLDALRCAIESAKQDYRDVITCAEYPRYSSEIGFHDVSDTIRRVVIDEDWRQYESWLRR